jgi:hypothetical protein
MRDEFEYIIDQFRQRDNLGVAQLGKLPSGSYIGLATIQSGSWPEISPSTQRTASSLSTVNSRSLRLGFILGGHLQPSREFLTRQLSFSGASISEGVHKG